MIGAAEKIPKKDRLSGTFLCTRERERDPARRMSIIRHAHGDPADGTRPDEVSYVAVQF